MSGRGQPLRKNPHGWSEVAFGFALAGGVLMISGWVLVKSGFFLWRDAPESAQGYANPILSEIDWAGALRKGAITAVAVSIIEEVLFRGVLLGIFLRAMRPGMAIATLSFLFAFVHFLEPPAGAVITDPEAGNAGFVLLGQILSRFADPLPMVSTFSILFAVGVVLGVARYRTASLWLPIGLHAGWILALVVFKAATWPVFELPDAARWFVGMTLLEGILPLVMVIMTGLVVALMTRRSLPDEIDDVGS